MREVGRRHGGRLRGRFERSEHRGDQRQQHDRGERHAERRHQIFGAVLEQVLHQAAAVALACAAIGA